MVVVVLEEKRCFLLKTARNIVVACGMFGVAGSRKSKVENELRCGVVSRLSISVSAMGQ